ncbi:hypothetical protein HN011_011909 [Eciton burchellii]|nr:hypothetical protein HN011_011909 [Eciton burchellii]
MMMPGIPSQIRHKEQPLWTSLYNSQANMRPVIKRPPIPSAFYNRYPYIFSSGLNTNNLRWKPYIPNFQSGSGKQPIAFGNRWLKSGNPIRTGIKMNNVPNATNVRYVPIVAFLPMSSQAQKIQQTQNDKQDTLPADTMTMPMNEEQSLLVNDYISMKKSPPRTTQTQQEEEEEEDESQEESLTETIETDPGLFPDDDISRLIEQALQNGELLNRDEWFKKHAATKEKQYSRRRKDQKPLMEGNDIDEGSWNLQDDLLSLGSPPICNNATFCERAVNYPEELVNQAIRDNDNLKLLLQNTEHVSDVEERLDFGETDDWPLCRSYIRTIYPRSAKTARHNWLYVINQNNFQQGIRVEVCVNEGSVCDDLEDYVPEGYKIFCKQNYVFRELVAVNRNGTIGKNNFKLPSNCCCHREFVGSE